MKNRTCGECRYMLHKDTFEVCTLCMTETAMFDNACEHFTPPTVGDRIRAMSDEGLAKKFVHKVSMKYVTGYVETYWVSGILRNKKWLKKEFAIEATIVELKKEVEDE
jgi:hypothetical protein